MSANKQLKRHIRQIAAQIKAPNSKGQLPCLFVTSIGNPEASFRNTRHNIGHAVLHYLMKNLNLSTSASSSASSLTTHATNAATFYIPSKLQSLVFVQSETFMNVSGKATLQANKWFKQNYSSQEYFPRFLILHDDLDVALGTVKFRLAGRAIRGHNGLRSIVSCLPDEFNTLQIGIDRPDSKDTSIVADYVLSRFTKPQQNIIHHSTFPMALDLMSEMLDQAGFLKNHS